MIGEPDAGKPHVRFDEGVQETYDTVTRLHPTLPAPPSRKCSSSDSSGRGELRGFGFGDAVAQQNCEALQGGLPVLHRHGG